MKGSYAEALTNKETAAKILLPLIEFEFGFIGEDSPSLVQASSNKPQLEVVFNICKTHKWTTSNRLFAKGQNFYFRISKKGFKEIYELAGPFVNKKRNEWANLIIERLGKKGGYMKGKKKTTEKVLTLLKQNQTWFTVTDICLRLRLLLNVVRTAIRELHTKGLIERKKVGRSVFWRAKI